MKQVMKDVGVKRGIAEPDLKYRPNDCPGAGTTSDQGVLVFQAPVLNIYFLEV